MLVPISMRTKAETDVFAGVKRCPHCGRIAAFHLCKVRQHASVLFLPLICMTTRWLEVCDSCGTYRALSFREYNQHKKAQMELLQQDKLPQQVILNDYTPEKLNWGRKLAAFLMALLWALCLLPVVPYLLVQPVIGLMMLALVVFPFAYTLGNLLDANRKKRAYQRTMEGRTSSM